MRPVFLLRAFAWNYRKKIAEFTELKGLILVDSSISLEVNEIVPYQDLAEDEFGDIIPCPTLIIKSVNSVKDDRRGRVEANDLKGEYSGYWSTTHTGLLIGQRYFEIVEVYTIQHLRY